MCHCHHSCRHLISPPERRFMGLGIPDPWVQHPVLVALKSPQKIEDEKWKEQCEEGVKPVTPHRQNHYQCVRHTSGWPPPIGICEALRQLCSCFNRRKTRTCPHCGRRVYKGDECSVCERSSDHFLEHKTTEMHSPCPHHAMEPSVTSPYNEERLKLKRRRLCCHCRSKIKKALATDVGTQTDKMYFAEKKHPPVEEENVVCCKHKKSKCSERSRKCPCCGRRLAKGEDCSRCRKPSIQVPEPKICVEHHHCRHERMQETERKEQQVTISRKKTPKECKNKICCLCRCELKHAKVKKREIGTQTESVSAPQKTTLPPSTTRKKKRKTVCCKHRKEVHGGGADRLNTAKEKSLFDALYRCWNEHALAVSSPGSNIGATNIPDSSDTNELSPRICNSAVSTLTLWSKASQLFVISPRGSRPPKDVATGKGIGREAQISGEKSAVSSIGCQTSFELLTHLLRSRRPEILRWFAESALKEISSSNRLRTNKKYCPRHSE